MTTSTSGRRATSRPAGRPLMSPLAVPGGLAPGIIPPAPDAPEIRRVLSDREQTMAEFADYLRTVNNRDGRPYEEKTIEAYLIPCRNLDKWLTARGIEDDFTVADTALLNRYFREYFLEHGRAGRTRCSATRSSCSTTCSASRVIPLPIARPSTGMRR